MAGMGQGSRSLLGAVDGYTSIGSRSLLADTITPTENQALIIVDAQECLTNTKGATWTYLKGDLKEDRPDLTCADPEAVLTQINALIPRFTTVVWTKDSHPPNHCSFTGTCNSI